MAVNETVFSRAMSNGATSSTSVAYASGTDCEDILLPIRASVVCQLSFDAAGTAKLQATNTPHDDVRAGNGVYADWDVGDVTTTVQAVCVGVTAVRVVRTSGTPRITITLA